MATYYLIPLDLEINKLNNSVQPKYLSELTGTIKGIPPLELEFDLKNNPIKWNKNYYIVAVFNLKDVIVLDKKIDVIKINEKNILKLTELGINLIETSTRNEIDKAVTLWLTEKENLLSEVLI